MFEVLKCAVVVWAQISGSLTQDTSEMYVGCVTVVFMLLKGQKKIPHCVSVCHLSPGLLAAGMVPYLVMSSCVLSDPSHSKPLSMQKTSTGT